MRLVHRPGFVRGAIIVVSILIGVALAVIGILAYEIARQEHLLPLDRSGPAGVAPTAPGASVAPSPVAATPTPTPTFPPAETPANRQPTGVSPTDTLPGVTAPIPEVPDVHPTYEPTTEPCQSCHSDVHGGGE